MSLPSMTMSNAGLERAPPAWTSRIAAALLPLLLILAWTAAVRLPFYFQTDKDEFFFSVIASEWLRGGLPYVATFDIKPPGLFFLYAMVQSVFGASQAVIKGMEIVAVALGGWALFSLVRRNGSERAALWAAILFPVYTVTLGGAIAVNMLLQLPFLIAAFWAALAAVRAEETPRRRMMAALLAGLSVGGAGMLKQTAIFEAVAIFAVLCLYGGRQQVWRLAALFVLGAALPAAAFALYFLAAGHFHEMFEAVVVLARQRTAAGVLTSYGPSLAYNFELPGIVGNAIAGSAPLILLWSGVLFLVIRLKRVRNAFPARLLVVATLWLAASYAGTMAGLSLSGYYLLTAVPSLLILSAAFFSHGLDVPVDHRRRAFAASVVLAIGAVAYVDHSQLFTPSVFLAGDYDATRKVSAEIRALGLRPDDRLLVLNRGFAIYTETGALPPSPYFHTVHMLGVFPVPSPDPLGQSLNANPRFIVIANPNVWHITELRSRIDRALAYVGRHYRVAARVKGEKDSFTIYEFAG